jgi:DNA-binding IclR family transcriptional regulator
MTAAELVEALRAAQSSPGGGEGITVTEMAEETGLPHDAIRALLRPMVMAGTVRATKKRMLAMDGAYRPVPSYALVEAAAPVKRGRAKAA